jgi:hypothetical protein
MNVETVDDSLGMNPGLVVALQQCAALTAYVYTGTYLTLIIMLPFKP